MFQRAAWSPANFEVEQQASGKPWKQQEGVQSKKRSLKSVALAVKGGLEALGDHCGTASTGNTGAAQWGVSSQRWPDWLCWGWIKKPTL